jgi:isopentenyl phosphate kinase
LLPEAVAVKIGGSLFSDKSAGTSLDRDVIAAYASSLAALARRHPGQVIMITGGGAAIHRLIRECTASGGFSLVSLTHEASLVRWAWAGALTAAGVKAFPLQLAAICEPGDQPELHAAALRNLLGHGVVPVLSADCVLDSDGSLRCLSSDRIPELLLTATGARMRVVALTDVPGILTGGPGGTAVLREVDATCPGPAYDALWEAGHWDATGAMRGKLDALVACALRGAECFIMPGDPPLPDLEFLFGETATWPGDLEYSRIARAPSPLEAES